MAVNTSYVNEFSKYHKSQHKTLQKPSFTDTEPRLTTCCRLKRENIDIDHKIINNSLRIKESQSTVILCAM